jgi:hypothetical protein
VIPVQPGRGWHVKTALETKRDAGLEAKYEFRADGTPAS